MGFRHTVAEISLSNLKHNFRVLKGLLPETAFFCPMIKANAYGHGDVEVARCLEELKTPALGVVLVEEGQRLRENGIKGPVLVFGHFDMDSSQAAIEAGLTPVLSNWEHLKSLEKLVPENTGYPVHLKFNTGMNRLGFEPREAAELSRYLKGQNRLHLEGVCTHLLNASDTAENGGRTAAQITDFGEIMRYFQGSDIQFHVQNSAALLKKLSASLGARPGVSLYGMIPDHIQNPAVELKPVMNLKTHVMFTREVKKNQTVSYGGTWTAKRDSIVAVVPIGYADGYCRSLSNKGLMLIRGRRVPVVGIVCMDYTILDLTDIIQKGSINPGEEVVAMGTQMGQSVGAEFLADLADTIPYEITTRIGARIPRVYISA